MADRPSVGMVMPPCRLTNVAADMHFSDAVFAAMVV